MGTETNQKIFAGWMQKGLTNFRKNTN